MESVSVSGLQKSDLCLYFSLHLLDWIGNTEQQMFLEAGCSSAHSHKAVYL